jgi:hypothetical protein
MVRSALFLSFLVAILALGLATGKSTDGLPSSEVLDAEARTIFWLKDEIRQPTTDEFGEDFKYPVGAWVHRDIWRNWIERSSNENGSTVDGLEEAKALAAGRLVKREVEALELCGDSSDQIWYTLQLLQDLDGAGVRIPQVDIGMSLAELRSKKQPALAACYEALFRLYWEPSDKNWRKFERACLEPNEDKESLALLFALVPSPYAKRTLTFLQKEKTQAALHFDGVFDETLGAKSIPTLEWLAAHAPKQAQPTSKPAAKAKSRPR